MENLNAMFWSWMALLMLGAFHGANPGMGWLFAVALGIQEQSSRAVWRAMMPLAMGHGLAIAGAIFIAAMAGVAATPQAVRWLVALLLIGSGLYRCFSHRHPRWARMRVGARGLTLWSFLMASAHGAGLMVLPVLFGMSAQAQGPSCHRMAAAAQDPWMALLATIVHGIGYLAATALAAWLVYEKFGLGLLRKAWLNLDLVWAFALIVTGSVTLFL